MAIYLFKGEPTETEAAAIVAALAAVDYETEDRFSSSEAQRLGRIGPPSRRRNISTLSFVAVVNVVVILIA